MIGLVDSAGAQVVNYRYNSWGKLVSVTDTSADQIGEKNPFRYRGYYYDAETGWYYLNSRYYDPEVCRFVNADDVETLEVQNDQSDKTFIHIVIIIRLAELINQEMFGNLQWREAGH